MTGVVYRVSTCETRRPPIMVMPRGRRSSEPGPMAMTRGSAPSIAAKVVMRIGRNRARHASWIASCGGTPRPPPAVQAKITHHDAVLLDEADKQNNSKKRDYRKFGPGDLGGQKGAQPCRWQRRDDGQGVREAFVENTKDNIDRNQRR